MTYSEVWLQALMNMISQISSRLRFNALKTGLNKWRIAFLIFALAYGIITFLALRSTPMEWDEVAHLNGGSFLAWEEYDKFTANAFYPPLFDIITFCFFEILGVSLVAARLVSLIFSILALWAVFELAYDLYGGKVALLSTVFLGIMPGYFWLSRLALLETMLVFFLTTSLFFFFRWLKTRRDKNVVFSGLAIGFGFLAKYQILVAFLVIFLSIIFLARNQLKQALKKFSLSIICAILVVLPWLVIAYQIYATKIFGEWMYAVQVGNPERLVYSERYPLPIFYLIEIVWPYNEIHPISLFLYVACLLGLGFLVWRHRAEDKYVFIWFTAVFAFFTLIVNKHWRYVLPLFPALAISASVLIIYVLSRLQSSWNVTTIVKKKWQAKFAAGLLIVCVASAMAYSVNDAYQNLAEYQITIDIEGATKYAIARMNSNESIMVLCPFNFFNRDMVRFYLWADGDNSIRVLQYPRVPVDTYTPNFNISELIDICKRTHVKYLFTYEFGGTVPYYNTTLNLQQIYQQIYASGNFSRITNEATFGANPRRIIVLTYLG